MGFAFHPSNLTSSGSQSFAETLGDSKGRSPWRAFGDFPRDGKVTRGGGAERPPGGCRDYCPAKAPGVEGRSAFLVGAGTTVPQRPPGWRGGAPSWWVQGLLSRKGPRGGGAERPYMGRSAEDGAQPLLALGKGPRVLKLLYPSRREKTTAFSRRWAVEKQTAAAVKKKEQKKRAASRYRKKSKNRSKNNVDNLIIPALPPKIKPFFQIFPSFLPDAPKSPLWKSWGNRRGISVKNKKKD